MTQIFISYSRKDLAFVEQLAADLQAAGLDVWYDLSGLEGGQRWSREIEKAIQDSQYVLVVLSPDSVASKWVEEEFLYASELGKKIIPLFYKPCALPFGYRTLHFIDVQGSKYKQKFGEILRALDVKPIVQKESPPPLPEKSPSVKPEVKIDKSPKHKPSKAKSKLNPRLIIGFFGLIVIMVAGIFGFPYLGGIFSTKPEATVTATWTARPLNATEAAFISKVAPTQAPQTATVSVLLTNVAGGSTKIAAETQLPAEITDEFGVEMVLVSKGEFFMGADSEDINLLCENISTSDCPSWYEDIALHQIFIDDFYIDKYEVTNKSYQECVDGGACQPPHWTGSKTRNNYYGEQEFENYPVIYVDGNMAASYCAWRDIRLPTEQEWEKAARGTDDRTFPWGDDFSCRNGNFDDVWDGNTYLSDVIPGGENCDNYSDTAPVGYFRDGMSPYGIYDMAGNVEEWVIKFTLDTTTSSDSKFGLRGGSLSDSDIQSFFTFKKGFINYGASLYDYYRGFRCAKDATP